MPNVHRQDLNKIELTLDYNFRGLKMWQLL